MNVLLLLLALATPAPQVVDSIAQKVNDRYVLVDEAPRIAERLREKARSGAYDAVTTEAKLAEALTNDLREIGADLHFAVEFDPEREQRLIAAGVGTRRKLPELPPTAEELERM